ncbi:PaaX family transcriptional regulator C-terminal domain-containing protein [Streptomyces chumphonensis]|nr:PaaX family transcriptional regulator C-terminal domain-containing protein [Streptomyces chumphonensis]
MPTPRTESVPEAPVPEVSTRMLVHALVRPDSTVPADELYAVAGALGMTDQQVRLCVKRLVAEGRFSQHGRGRRAVLHASPGTAETLAVNLEFVRHAYRQDQGLAPWDGTWRLFAFAIPESARAVRDELRSTLVYLGAAAVQGGLYVCANAVTALVEEAAQRLGAAAGLTVLTSRDLRVGALTEPRDLAAGLWPLEEIAPRHERLAALARWQLDRLDAGPAPDGAERLAMAVALISEFTRAHEPDPLLPPELLPARWPGPRARELTAACWSRLTPPEPATGPRLFRAYGPVLAEAAARGAGQPSGRRSPRS